MMSTPNVIRSSNNNGNWKDPTVYRLPKEGEDEQRPENYCDYRSSGGPILSYVWCTAAANTTRRTGSYDCEAIENESDDSNLVGNNGTDQDTSEVHPKSILQGQTLYLGAEISTTDNCMYCIPGHADRVLKIDPQTDHAVQVGPKFVGKYKWLRGVEWHGVVYGLPCHSDTVLKIDVPNNRISELFIQYEAFFTDDVDAAHRERHREWKYHGGNISPVDGCIYTIPQSAQYVLKIDPTTDTCTLVNGPKMDGMYQFYGGVVGQQDGAIYGTS
jgi:hypothetical protein